MRITEGAIKMNKKEIERMVSLADERYIEELYTEKLNAKRKRPLLWFAAAAAVMAVVCGGISYLISSAGNNDKIVLENAFAAEGRPNDYSIYFQNRTGGVSDAHIADAEKDDKIYVVTDKSKLDKALPFDTEDIFTVTADVICDSKNNNAPYAAEVRFSYDPESKVNISMCDEGRLSKVNTENAIPEKMGNVDVYGFDMSTGSVNNYDICLEAYFVSNGTEYVVTSKNTDHNKLGNIIYELISSDFNPRSIDISNARSDALFRSEEVSIEYANRLEPFKDLVPDAQNGFVLYRGVICTYRETAEGSELYSLSVSFADVSPLPNTTYNKIIQLDYNTEYNGNDGQAGELLHISDIKLENLVLVFGDGNNTKGSLTVKCGAFYLTVYAENCSANEVWQYINIIKSNYHPADDTYSTDNSIYFKDAGMTAIIDYTLDAGGESYNFISEYAAGLMSFDTGVFDDGRAIVYCDENGKPVNASVNLYCSPMAREYGVSIVISDEGKLYPGYEFEETEPVKRSGVDIYGYTLGEAGGGFKNMCACFVSEGIGYSVDFRGMSYDEAISIIDGLIESGIKASDFDLSQGSSSDEDLYKAYFRIVHTSDRLSDEFDLNKYNNYNKYDEEYARDILKKSFDTSKFPNVLANMCCDENGRQVNGDINLLNSLGTEPNAPLCSIRFSMDGEQFNYYDMKDPKELCGVQVYGAEEVHWDGTENSLYIDFVNGGIAYSLYFYRMDYKDAIDIAAGIIGSGLSANDFDPSKAEYSMNTEKIGTDRLAELNNDSVFAGYIPINESIGDMKLFRNADNTGDWNSYVTVQEKGKNDTFILNIYYTADVKTEDDRFISLVYSDDDTTVDAGHESGIPLIELDSLTREWLDGLFRAHGDDRFVRYNFYLSAGSFYINVNALCTSDDLWQCLCMIEPKLADRENTDGTELTPAEANQKESFTGHIPQSASIDGLTADKTVRYYPVSLGDDIGGGLKANSYGFGMEYGYSGENGTITIKLMDYTYQTYGSEWQDIYMCESQLSPEFLAESFEQPSEREGNRTYKFRIDFYSGCHAEITADCAPETLWKCLGEMSVYAKEDDGKTVYYCGRAFNKSDLSEEMLEWLEWYNSMDSIGQATVSYLPSELYIPAE